MHGRKVRNSLRALPRVNADDPLGNGWVMLSSAPSVPLLALDVTASVDATALPGSDLHRVAARGTHRMDPDRALVERALAGEEAAFRQLFVRHRDDAARVVYRMLGPSPEVEDVVQEVFLHVYRSLKSFRGDSRFSTWLYRLAVNVTRMHLRRKRSRPRFADVEVPDAAPSEELVILDPGEQVDQRARIKALYRLLEQISEKKREVIVLHDFEGMPATEIADTLGIPVLTVRTRLFYARKELYAAMASDPSLKAVVAAVAERLPAVPTEESAARGSDEP
jgi:RNA polymerase sigma-70 factor (ECF subfamily)